MTNRTAYGVTLWALPRFRREQLYLGSTAQLTMACNQASYLEDATPPTVLAPLDKSVTELQNILLTADSLDNTCP